MQLGAGEGGGDELVAVLGPGVADLDLSGHGSECSRISAGWNERAAAGHHLREVSREEQFQGLFDLNYHRVLGYAIRRCDRREDAEDAVAETFTVAWRRLEDVPAEGDARPWLLGVARKVLANQRRGRDRRARLVERLAQLPAPVAGDYGGGEIGDVARAFAELRADDREVLALLSWEELTPAEIAIVLGCSGGAARKRVLRARRRFAGLLDAGATAAPPQSFDPPRSETEEA
jgi:RNA polymerase sigma-70 factor (ECF subfamily)